MPVNVARSTSSLTALVSTGPRARRLPGPKWWRHFQTPRRTPTERSNGAALPVAVGNLARIVALLRTPVSWKAGTRGACALPGLRKRKSGHGNGVASGPTPANPFRAAGQVEARSLFQRALGADWRLVCGHPCGDGDPVACGFPSVSRVHALALMGSEGAKHDRTPAREGAPSPQLQPSQH